MKYSSNNKPLVCMQTNSTCYKQTSKMQIKGILWHSTGVNNTNLKRYVQPSDNAPDKQEMLQLLGVNYNKNDWNHAYVEAGLNAWIGKLADGTVTTIQTMPWEYRPWGCGSGSKGSCNNGWIQFEICEDGLNDSVYFNKVYQEACELTAYLCKLYNIDPMGTIVYNGVQVPTILCHIDSYNLGLGSGHSDVLHWFPKFGKNMTTVRSDVSRLLKSIDSHIEQEVPKENKPVQPVTQEFKLGDEVSLVPGATYANGKTIPSWVFATKLYVREIKKDGSIIISTLKSGAITGTVKKESLTPYGQNSMNPVGTSFKVKINTAVLNVRSGPSTSYIITTSVKKNEVYTIVEETNGWGKLKSGAGWICLDYTKRV